MPEQYKYRAVSNDGRKSSGIITANGPSTVEEFLREQSLLPLEISEVKQKHSISFLNFLKRTDYESIIMFTGNLATMYRAGLPLLRALSVMKIGPPKSRFNLALKQIGLDMQAGKLLSEAMNEHPDLFSRVYVNCISAGEESGKLDSTLDELALMLEREMELIRQIRSGIRYPVMVVMAVIGAFVVMMNFVLPRFVAFYSTFDAELPLPTRIFLGTSNFFTQYWPFMIAALIALGFIFKKLLEHGKSRTWLENVLLKLPILGALIIRGNIARFSLMFRLLVSAGLPIVKSLDILSSTMGNSVIAAEIRQLGQLFREGMEAEVLSGQFRIFPEQALQMLAIGLESGNLETVLREIGEHYTKQVMYTSRQLTAIIEPILTLVLGGMVLMLALAIFLPMWSLIKVFQG